MLTFLLAYLLLAFAPGVVCKAALVLLLLMGTYARIC